ncbi:Predicted dehydrogenase [Lutibacter oricola]|uniref:Predicted dehydrogenase n=1 Tax=Lutibacter oricola TaxID=762486 RepID=A0A1H3DMJ5_9FLAO|nr:Gfo/Idh/MocA family oxidoreductase [Lutibacter oricola]SDX67611.1 Predicted dehydrogenase [Lutibacter oricola]
MKRYFNDGNIRWGIIGCGDVTEIKSGPPYYSIEEFSLEAVMRRDEHRAKDYAKRHNVPKYYSNADDLINDPNVDAIYIATPPDSHKFYGLKVADAGKPCCIEKPLSPSYNESLAIVEAFKKINLPLFVAYYRRTLPRFLKVKEWIDSGIIGEIRHINSKLHIPPSNLDLSEEYNWRTDIKIAPAGYFDDLASHGLDLFTYFLGNIKEAQGVSLNQQKLYTAKDAVSASWIHEIGITGVGSWNFGTYDREDLVVIYGEKGQIEFSVFDENPIKLVSESENLELNIEHPKHVQYYHVEAMRDYFSENVSHPSTGETALHTSWVMDKILGKI